MNIPFKNGRLETPTPVTDALHDEMSDDCIEDIERYARMRWHAEDEERQIEHLRSEIKRLETVILKLEPERL